MSKDISDTTNKFLSQILENNKIYTESTKDEKVRYIKDKYGLHHGKGKRKKMKKK